MLASLRSPEIWLRTPYILRIQLKDNQSLSKKIHQNKSKKPKQKKNSNRHMKKLNKNISILFEILTMLKLKTSTKNTLIRSKTKQRSKPAKTYRMKGTRKGCAVKKRGAEQGEGGEKEEKNQCSSGEGGRGGDGWDRATDVGSTAKGSHWKSGAPSRGPWIAEEEHALASAPLELLGPSRMIRERERKRSIYECSHFSIM